MMRPSLGVLALVFLLTAVSVPVRAQELRLVRVVLLSRHGVRSPTETLAELDKHVATPWGRWPVAPGELTPHGGELMRLMGGYYRTLYALPADDCPAPGAVDAWADVDQRTRLTAQALLDGIAPGCGLKERHQADVSRADPLFHSAKAGLCPIDEALARQAILQRVGGNLQTVLDSHAQPFAKLQEVLCPSRLAGSGAGCGLRAHASAIELHDGRVAIEGPVRIASTMTEIFQLEAAEGMPREQVAWGRLRDDEALRDLMVLHTLDFDLTQRTRYIARRSGSALLAAIMRDLESRDAPKFTLFVGHDTNLANLAALLGVHWLISGFQPDDPSPGSALAFEGLRDPKSGARYVRLTYRAQTLEQMRQGTRLDAAHPPGRAAISLPGCQGAERDGACSLTRFKAIVEASLDQACTIAK